MPKTTGERWLSMAEAAEYLGVPARTMHTFIARGEIRTTGWPLLISRSELESFVRRSRIKPGELRHLHSPAVEGERDGEDL